MINLNEEVTIPLFEYIDLVRIQAKYDELREYVFYLQEHSRKTTHEALCDIKEGGVEDATN